MPQEVPTILPLELQRIPHHGIMLIPQQALEVEVQGIQHLDLPVTRLAEVRLSLLPRIPHLQPPGLTRQLLLTQNQETELPTIRLVDTLSQEVLVADGV
jgi:hypothetical protein